MSLTLNITDHWSDGKRILVTATLTATGSYVTGGDIIPLNNPLIKSNSGPVWAEAQIFGGFDLFVSLGTAINPGQPAPATLSRLRVVTSSTGLELTQGAYPVSITGNVINFFAIFPKLI